MKHEDDAITREAKRTLDQRDLNARLEAHRRWLDDPGSGTRLQLRDTDLVGLTLTGNLRLADFMKCDLTACTFRDVTFNGTRFVECDGTGALFDQVVSTGSRTQMLNCDLRGTTWRQARLVNLGLTDVQMDGATLEFSSVTGTTMLQVRFIGATFRDFQFAGGTAGGCDFTDARVERVKMLRWKANGCKFPKLQMGEVLSFEGTTLSGCDLRAAVGNGLDFSGDGANALKLDSLAYSDLSEAELTQSVFKGVDVRGCNFTAAALAGAVLTACDLAGCAFDRASGVNVKLNEAMADHVSFRGADLRGAEALQLHAARAIFADAKLDAVLFDFADLRGTDFRGAALGGTTSPAHFGGADLDGALWIDGRRCAPGSLGQCRIDPRIAATKAGAPH